MSYELADAHVDDMRASEWRLNRVTFTGAAILLRSKAAYRNTSFRVVRESDAAQQVAASAAAQRTHAVRQPARRIERPRASVVRPMPLDAPSQRRTDGGR